MIRLICDNKTCQTEIEGTGKEILEDALDAVHGLYTALYKNDRMIAVLFAAMVKAEHENIFDMDETELLEFTNKTEDKHLTAEKAEKRMDEMREEMKEITRKLMEE